MSAPGAPPRVTRGTLAHPRGARSAAAAAQPSPPQGGPLAGHTPRRRSGSNLPCQKTNGPHGRPEAGDGRPKIRARGHTQPLPSSPSLTGSGGEDKRGAPRTDREERTRSPGTPVPRPARFRLGPGEHDHTTSIRGAEVEQGEARRGQSPEGPAFSLAGSLHPPPPRLRRERPTTPRGEHLTRGAEPTGRGSSQPPPGAHSGGEGRRG